MSNIPPTFSIDDLRQLFSECGPCEVIVGEASRELLRRNEHYYAFINFDFTFEAESAVRRMNGYVIHGYRLYVKHQHSDAAPYPTTTSKTYTIKITNIPKAATEGDLTEMFGFGSTAHIVSLKLNETGTESDVNFAYVNYASDADADRAVQVLNGGIMRGLKLVVKHNRRPSGTRDSSSTSSSTAADGSSVKIIIAEGSVDENELYHFFSRFGELKDVPKVRQGSPNFAYINYKNAADARTASQCPILQIKPGVSIKVRPPSDVSVPIIPTADAVNTNNPFQWKPKASVFKSKKIKCSVIIAQMLTSSDKHQQSIHPVTMTRDKNGIVLFGANLNLPSAETRVLAHIADLEKEHTEKVIELPCMYIPAFCDKTFANSLSNIEQQCFVSILVCITPQCTQDLLTFSTLVHSKLASVDAAEISCLGISLSQKNPSDSSAPSSENRLCNFVWSFKNDLQSYTPYDAVSCAKLNEHYINSPQGTVQLCITTTVRPILYRVDFAAMTQTNTETGHIRKIKKSDPSASSSSLSYTWLYEDDSKRMVPYTASECNAIEVMYLSNNPTDLTICNATYTFDFTRMKQINKVTRQERKIERQPFATMPTQTTTFKLQISGLGSFFKEAESKLIQELDKSLVKRTHPLPTAADSKFQTEILQDLRKYFVMPEIVGDSVQVLGVQGYIEKVMLVIREKTLLEKERLAQTPLAQHSEVPPFWEPQTDHFVMKELVRHDTEWKKVEDKIHKTLPYRLITSIKRIQNKWLWDRYSFAKQRMAGRNGGITNEISLFHGTGTTPPEKVYKSEQGFDFRFSTSGMWGTGTYFAVNASYSDNYCYQLSHGKQMILASVLTGETYRCPPDGSLKKPPIKPRKHGSFEDERYDSVSGHTGGSDVFIIYDHEKAYPYYLITYN